MTMVIVTYHAIDDARSPVSTAAADFDTDLRRLRDAGVKFVSLDDCAAWLTGANGTPSGDANRSAGELRVAITFDDGYASIAELAVPVLQRYGAPATVFVIAGRLGEDNRWSGQWRGIPRLPLVTDAQVRALARSGIGIGSHSWSHPRLTDLDDAALKRECVDAADFLEQIIGSEVRHFAYPHGIREAREIACAARRYRTAANACPGVVAPGASLHDLPRVDPHDLRVAVRWRLTRGSVLQPYFAARRVVRGIRRSVIAPAPIKR